MWDPKRTPSGASPSFPPPPASVPAAPLLIGGTSLFCRQEGAGVEGAGLPGDLRRPERRVGAHLGNMQGESQYWH